MSTNNAKSLAPSNHTHPRFGITIHQHKVCSLGTLERSHNREVRFQTHPGQGLAQDVDGGSVHSTSMFSQENRYLSWYDLNLMKKKYNRETNGSRF